MRSVIALVLCFAAVASAGERVRTKHQWRCHYVNGVWFCDMVDHPLSALRGREGRIFLFDRKPLELPPLLSPPASLRER